MRSTRKSGLIVLFLSSTLAFVLAGCGGNDLDQRARDEKTRDEVAKATERAKPAIEHAGKELERGAERAAEEAHAAAQGVKEGWDRGGQHAVDLNSASERDLVGLPGITGRDARKIIAGRPYRNKHDVVSKGILSEDAYLKIRDDVTAN